MNEKYEIKTVEDFMKIPADRIDQCVKEFGQFLQFHAFVQTVGAEIQSPIVSKPVFVWCDDGEEIANVQLHDIKTGELLSEIPVEMK